MAASSFDRALSLVLANEGGFVDDPRDPGGATNLGITRATLARARGRAVGVGEVRRLGRGEAAAIYRRFYWKAVRADELPAGLDLAVFDLAVNSGPSRAVRLLQRALGCREDGILGPVTLGAAAGREPAATIRALGRARLAFLRGLPTWSAFGRGWARRVARVERAALALAAASPSKASPPPRPAALSPRSWWRAVLAALRPGLRSPAVPLLKETSMPSSIPSVLFDILGAAIARAGSDPRVALGPDRARDLADAVQRTVAADPRAQTIQEAPPPKPWWRSTTIWGVAISAGLKALAIAFPGAVDPGWAEPLQEVVLLGASFLGDALAVFGRFKARRPLAG